MSRILAIKTLISMLVRKLVKLITVNDPNNCTVNKIKKKYIQS